MFTYQIYAETTPKRPNKIIAAHKILAGDSDVRLLLDMVASARRVSPFMLLSPVRGDARVCLSRQIAMYLIHVALGRTQTYTAQIFCRDRTTVAYACARIEDKRDDARFDRALTCFECTLNLAISNSSELAECN